MDAILNAGITILKPSAAILRDVEPERHWQPSHDAVPWKAYHTREKLVPVRDLAFGELGCVSGNAVIPIPCQLMRFCQDSRRWMPRIHAASL
jgi:hypothetical protein